MHLEGNFYKIDSFTQKEENNYSFVVTILPGHSIYEGHFPEQPVVPGVCTLTIIRECISRILEKEISFATINLLYPYLTYTKLIISSFGAFVISTLRA